jgi:intein/homing endonuclease
MGGSGNYGGPQSLGAGSNTALSGTSSFFSPQLSTDFLELPQSLREKREIYRHFYNTDPLVGQAIDIHTELPLSKVRLSKPKPRTFPKGFKDANDYGKYILDFFERMCTRISLFNRLIMGTHHYWLDGNVFFFAEDSVVEVPPEVGYKIEKIPRAVLNDDGSGSEFEDENVEEHTDREERELEYYQKNYQGWSKLIILPIDQVKLTTFSFTDKVRIELIPSERDRALFSQAKSGDERAQEMVEEIPPEVREYLEAGKLIPLGTDADEGSFCYHLAGRRGAGEDLGASLLDRCHLAGTPVLVKRDNLVQQISIENLDPDTDLVLSHNGLWREFEIGVRKVDEEITILSVSKLHPPIGSTSDHRYPVLRGDQVIELQASSIKSGDYLQVAQLPLSESISAVDLADFMSCLPESLYTARKSGNESSIRFEVLETTDQTFNVSYQKDQTDPKRIGRTGDLNTILDWAATLTEPVTMKSSEVCDKFGLHPVTLKELRSQLVALGYGVTVTKCKSITFPPNIKGIQVSKRADYLKNFPRRVNLDSDLGYFLGYWLGDGHISKQLGLDYGVLGFTYGPNEPASILSMSNIKATLDRLKVAWSESPVGSGVHLSGYQDALVRWLSQNFGHTCEDKHLPGWIFDDPRDFLKGILRGFCDSDGDVVIKKDGSVSIRFNGTNKVLMEQIFLLCTSLGIPASKSKPTKERWVKQADGRLSWAKPCYPVHFTHGPSVKSFFESGFLAKRRGPEVWKNGRPGSRHVEHDGNLFYRVSNVESASHVGPVYSLNVHGDHTFHVCGVVTKNCLRTLYYREKLRQAQTLIATRAMTPKRLVWGEGLSDPDVDDLREQVDLALVDPDYSIVTNYEVHWEEIGSRDRLLDLSGEYEITDKQLFAGLGVTESLLNGESTFSGDRVKLEVLNTRYLLFREVVQEYVENYLFKPVARRKGFVEIDEWGNEVVLYPKLSFTRLALRDSQDTFDALFNLYQKGSVPIETILELFNLDAADIQEKLERDTFTSNDAIFNEVVRGIYSEVGRMLADKTDVMEKIAAYLKLTVKSEPPAEEESRFG